MNSSRRNLDLHVSNHSNTSMKIPSISTSRFHVDLQVSNHNNDSMNVLTVDDENNNNKLRTLPQQKQKQHRISFTEIELIIRWNNQGVDCINRFNFSQAFNYFKKSLEKANELSFFLMLPSYQTLLPLKKRLSRQSSNDSIASITNAPEYTDNIIEAGQYEYEEGMNTLYSNPVMISENATIIDNEEESNDEFLLKSTQSAIVSRCVLTALFNLGILSVRLKKDDEATTYFCQALDVVQQQSSEAKKSPCTSSSSSSSSVLLSEEKNTKKKKQETPNIIAILHNIGYIQYRRGNYENAAKTYKKALRAAFFNSNSSESLVSRDIDIATTFNCLGVIKYRATDESGSSRTNGKSFRREENSKNNTINDISSNSNTSNSGNNKAIEILQESLAIQRTILGLECDHCKNYATTLNNLGRVYYIDQKYEMALKVYLEAQKIRSKVLGEEHLDVAAIEYNIGQTFRQRGDLLDAIDHFKKFLSIMKKHRNSVDHHRDVGNALRCMAQIYHEQKIYDKASKMYKQALFVGKATLGQFHEEIATTLNKLGNLYYEAGDYDNALSTYSQGLEIEREVLDASHPNIVVTLTNIGEIHKIRGAYEDALKVHEEAFQIQQKRLGRLHPEVCSTLISVATIHYDTHKYAKALKTYKRVLEIQRKDCGDDHLDVAATLNSVGLVLFKMELHEYALHAFNESLSIRKRLLGPDHSSVAIILYNIGAVYLELNDDADTALLYYNETLRVEREALGHDHTDVALTLEHVGYVYQQQGEISIAVDHFLDALKIYKINAKKLEQKQKDDKKRDERKCDNKNSSSSSLSSSSIDNNQYRQETEEIYMSIAQTLNNVGNLYLQRGQTKKMIEIFSEAVVYFEKCGKSSEELNICGFNYYGLSKMHPECSAVA